MRRQLLTITLVAATLGAPILVATNAAANREVASTRPAGDNPRTSPPSPHACLADLLQSLVSGDNPLISEVTQSQPFSPYGNDATDEAGESTIADEFELIINPAPFALPVKAGNGTVVRVDPTGSVSNQLWGDYFTLDPLLDGMVPTFGGTRSDMIDDTLLGLGVDPSRSDPQEALGTTIRVARPMVPGADLYRGPITVWGGHMRGNYESGGGCAGSPYIYELGRAWSRVGGTNWTPGDAFPKDLFSGASDAMVIRCDGGWAVDRMVNNGTGFDSIGTNTTALVFEIGFIAFTPTEEFVDTVGYRLFSFRTPAVGGYRADNTIATTYPAFPGLMEPMTTVVVGSPFPTADHGPFPLGLDLTSLNAGTETNPCPGDWSGVFETYLWDTRTEGTLDASLYQFASGQWTSGTITHDLSEWSLSTEGGGDGYGEMFDLMGSGGQYSYVTDGGECTYSVSISEGWDQMTSALAEFVPATSSEPDPSKEPTSSPTEESSTPPTAESPTPSTTGTDNGGDGFPWGPASIIVGLGLLVAGYFTSRSRKDGGDDTTPPPTGVTSGPVATTAADPGDPCDRLRRMYAAAKAAAEKARRAADEAETRADEAEVKAGQADSASRKAETAAGDAERDRKRAERHRNAPPASESESWIEDSETGERITGTDLRLRREAAADAWKGYHDNPSSDSAAETEEQWSHLDDEGARAKRRSEWEADQAERAKELADAEAAEQAAKSARDQANEARDAADSAAKSARADADRLEGEAAAAEARADELKKDLDECLGLKSGPTTRWGGPVGLGEDPDGGCFPEGNVERRVLDSFKQTVKVDTWVTIRSSSQSHLEAERIAGEIEWWQHMFGTASAAINVKGAVEGLGTRAVSDAVSTAASGATVIAGDSPLIGIDIPTVPSQVPVVILEGLAATTKTIIRSFGGWIKRNHIETIAEFGFQQRDVELTWVEMWKCHNGVKTCVERVLEMKMGAVGNSGSIRREVFQPIENWEPRVQGLARTLAHQAQSSSRRMIEFMQKYQAGPCGG